MHHPIFPIAALMIFSACTSETSTTTEVGDHSTPTYVMDTHSNARPNEAVIKHLDLAIAVDMEGQAISGTASYDIEAPHGSKIIFDTEDLVIESVTLADGNNAEFSLGDSTMLGRALTIVLPEHMDRVTIAYYTTKKAKALQWLVPDQTADKKFPFLFTQGQAALTRSWIPVQDSPGIRFTYDAKVNVPVELMALMSATNPQERSSDGTYVFKMDKPIPAYLMALAVGDLVFKPIGKRTGVYAERSVIDKATYEFAEMEKMLETAEGLYGPYRWGRYDVIVLPPSFPFGGMENPMLTFATPTILAGDRSLTSLIAHELAHSWSGNLVTNATWDDFWLNEGFTVYFENRITEAIFGKDFANMSAMIGRQDLTAELEHIAQGPHPEDTHLRLHLEGRDPDDGMTDIAYEKGFAFLLLLEEKVGREKFDAFLRNYFDTYAFQSMTTDRFIGHLNNDLLEPTNTTIDLTAWIDGPGLPTDAPVPFSDRFVKVEDQIARWKEGIPAAALETNEWSAFEWMHFIRHLPKQLSMAQMDDLDNAFHFTQSGNAEILAAWLEQCIRNDHEAAYTTLDRFLNEVGRRKFLTPLYTAMLSTEKGKLMAQVIYAKARNNYHSVAVHTMDDLLSWKAVKPTATF
ncbi:MAG: M1 family metallopeptidase [Flavobacteriales bacterium]|nr:M1 family metallopeptidase [Flavobacteriales bacterium]MBK6946066.1 M1 family metallopeptidase [Flavobacteriales bacterium]MBK9536899.1 M1 family metallopeptidase [Flavobacteriales bacterium]MBP9138980.1 M1 family metallopeptidase [Flavobacteriales bacterium]HQV52896.1 M1 family metallopeptidase [Flavobacteriales bacterium]